MLGASSVYNHLLFFPAACVSDGQKSVWGPSRLEVRSIHSNSSLVWNS